MSVCGVLPAGRLTERADGCVVSGLTVAIVSVQVGYERQRSYGR